MNAQVLPVSDAMTAFCNNCAQLSLESRLIKFWFYKRVDWLNLLFSGEKNSLDIINIPEYVFIIQFFSSNNRANRV